MNDRQRTYVQVIFKADQEAEKWVRIDGAAGKRTPPAAEWRWLQFSLGDGVRGAYTGIQSALESRGVWDSGAGATLEALRSRGLVLLRHEAGTLGGLRVDVRMTTAGRAAARAGLGIAAVRKPRGLLSRGLWNQFVKAVIAELAGEPVEHLWRETHLYLGTGYRFRGHPSRGYLEEINPSGGPYGTRWFLTDAGRSHLAEHLDTYRQLYPDVDTRGLATGLSERPAEPAADRLADPPGERP